MEITDPRDLLILSAALQVYHFVSPDMAQDALTEHEEMFTDEAAEELEKRIVDLANRANAATRDALPEGVAHSSELPEKLRMYGIWGSHAVRGAEMFRNLTMDLRWQLLRGLTAKNN